MMTALSRLRGFGLVALFATAFVLSACEEDGPAEEAGEKIDMSTIVRDLDLNSELADTLDFAGILSRSTWDVMRPSGTVDVASHHRKQPGSEELGHELRVLLRDVSSHAEWLPYPATGLSGEIRVADEIGEFDDIRGMVKESRVAASDGRIEHADGESRFRATISAVSLPVDERFSNLLSGPLKAAFDERQVRGTIEVPGLDLAFRFPDVGDGFELVMRGSVVAKDTSMVLVTPIEEIHGLLEFEESVIWRDGGNVVCTASDVSANILGHRISDLGGRLSAVPERVRIEDVGLSMHSGRIESGGPDGLAMTYELATEELTANLRWSQLSLTEFLRAVGSDSSVWRGTMSGALDLERMVRADLVDARGRGTLRIDDGKLGEVPMFTAIYGFLEPRNRPQFDALELVVDVHDRLIELERMELKSPIVEVTGSGTVGMDGYLDIVLEFPDFFASASDWLFLPKVLQAITSPLVRFHVFGYMRSPQARPRWLFQDDPDRRSIDPIPARPPTRSRRPF